MCMYVYMYLCEHTCIEYCDTYTTQTCTHTHTHTLYARRGMDCKGNVGWSRDGRAVYHVSSVGVSMDVSTAHQGLFLGHTGDLDVCLSVLLSVYLSVFLYICLSVCLSVCLYVCIPVCLSVCLFVCPSVRNGYVYSSPGIVSGTHRSS
jgi:hypothetical protein